MLKLVRIDFPLLDKPGKVKNRPAVCLTKPIGRYNLVIVAPLSSKTSEILDTGITLVQTAHAFAMTGLSTTSVIQLHKLMCISEKRLQGEIGTLSAEWEDEVREKLRRLFALK
jgi:mRNA interferase MazF